MTIQTQFIKDNLGKKIGVFLPIKDFEKLIKELEELSDVRLYDEAKQEDDGTRISFDDYIAKRKKKNA